MEVITTDRLKISLNERDGGEHGLVRVKNTYTQIVLGGGGKVFRKVEITRCVTVVRQTDANRH